MAYDITQAKELVIRAGRELKESGLIARTWGNISARVSDEEFVITPSGLAYESLTAEDIVTVRIKDCSYEGSVKPSSEKGVHAAVYKLRPDAQFVIHTHQDYATAISAFGKRFTVKENSRTSEILGSGVPTAKYALSSTRALANNAASCLRSNPDCRCILLRNHGTVCIGSSYEDAFRIARVLEERTEKKVLSLIGKDFPAEALEKKPLSEYNIVLHKEIHDEADRHYRLFERAGVSCVIETSAPLIRKISEYGKSMPAYVDDLAQMAGLSIRCVPEDATDEQISKALSGAASAVLVKGKGAIATGGSQDDAEALVMVLNKGALAALLARSGQKIRRVGVAGGSLEHAVYTRKYAKLKDQDSEKEREDA